MRAGRQDGVEGRCAHGLRRDARQVGLPEEAALAGGAITTLQGAPADMKRMGLANGDRVRVTTETGRQIEVAVTAATGDELPPGLLFIAYGDLSSRLMDGETHGSGMPTSKGFDVSMEKLG